MFTIVYFKKTQEVDAVVSFLEWQNIRYKLKQDNETLRLTNGMNEPALLHPQTQEIECFGFWKIIKHIKDKGLILC